MFRLGRHHARLTRWHRDLVGVDNVAANARRRDVAGRNVAHVNDPVEHPARRVPRSHSAVSRSKGARRFVRC